MSNQDPPFGSARDQGADALRSADSTVRNDLRSAADQAKSDLGRATDQAKQDFEALKSQASNQLHDLKEQASSQLQGLKGQATQELSNLKSQAQGQLGEAADKAKAYAGEQAGQLADRARSFASEQKDFAARQIGGVGDAVSRVADELSGDNSAVAGYAQNIAGTLHQFADSVQNKSVDDLFNLAQDFGRRQPIAFVGIAALAGFAATRFLLASADRQDEADARSAARRATSQGTQRSQPIRGTSPVRKPGDDYQVDFERGSEASGRPVAGAGNNGRI